MSRLPQRPVRYSASTSDLQNLFKRVRTDPYDVNLHGAVADAVDELHPGNKVSDLIRRQFGHGQYGGQGERDHLWENPVYNSYDGTHPYYAHLGEHGPFDLYLGHEGGVHPSTGAEMGPAGNQRWVVRAVLRQNRRPELNDTAYNFEFPHEEAHLIPRLFPAAEKYINRNPKMNYSPYFDMTPEQWRNAESRHFDEQMDEQERNRE